MRVCLGLQEPDLTKYCVCIKPQSEWEKCLRAPREKGLRSQFARAKKQRCLHQLILPAYNPSHCKFQVSPVNQPDDVTRSDHCCARTPFLAMCFKRACPLAAHRRRHQARATCCGGAHGSIRAGCGAQASCEPTRGGSVPARGGAWSTCSNCAARRASSGEGCAQRSGARGAAGGEGRARRSFQRATGSAGK